MNIDDILHKPANEILSNYWLNVWRCLVEEHSNHCREETSAYCYSFAVLRAQKCRPESTIDADVAVLADDYWVRNRANLKEYFFNLTCNAYADKTYAVIKDVDCCGWIDFGADPIYPDNRNNLAKHPFEAENLLHNGWLENALHDAKIKALLMTKSIDEDEKLDVQTIVLKTCAFGLNAIKSLFCKK